MAGLIIKPRSRIFHGHDWVYSSEIKKIFGDPKPGDIVTLKDFKDRPLGSGIYNPESQIVARRTSRRAQDLDADFFKRRLQRAADYRTRAGYTAEIPHRLVWSESDGLPGIVVDRYGSALVLQTLTLGMDQRKDLITAALVELFTPTCVIERNDNPVRKAEGLPLQSGLLHGEDPGKITVTDGTVSFKTQLLEAQKTGLYLDQFDSYHQVASHAGGRRVLDCFTNQGGFSLHCAKAGASSVLAVDISDTAIAATRENTALNALSIETETANVFDFLRASQQQKREFDLIILDPPSFTKSKKRVGEALRGYKEIHLRALQLLAPGGMLATFCCSHHVSAAEFRSVICSAAVDTKKTLRDVAAYRQRSDHPVIATIPETEYLKGALFEVVPSW